MGWEMVFEEEGEGGCGMFPATVPCGWMEAGGRIEVLIVDGSEGWVPWKFGGERSCDVMGKKLQAGLQSCN